MNDCHVVFTLNGSSSSFLQLSPIHIASNVINNPETDSILPSEHCLTVPGRFFFAFCPFIAGLPDLFVGFLGLVGVDILVCVLFVVLTKYTRRILLSCCTQYRPSGVCYWLTSIQSLFIKLLEYWELLVYTNIYKYLQVIKLAQVTNYSTLAPCFFPSLKIFLNIVISKDSIIWSSIIMFQKSIGLFVLISLFIL